MSIIKRLLSKPAHSANRTPEINYNSLIERGFLLVDVRTLEEYTASHIPRSISVPLSDLKSRLTYFSESNRPVVFYCKSGRRAEKAVQIVRAHQIECYNGGVMADLHPTLERHQYGVTSTIVESPSYAPIIPVKPRHTSR